jgi:basic membrane protein A and related proteins
MPLRRRPLLPLNLYALAAAALVSIALAGCSNSAATTTSGSTPATNTSTGSPSAPAGGELAVGFIYVGPKDDYGYNQAHADGAAAVKKMPGVKVMEEEKVPETADVQKSMESMIQLDGAKLIFPTSFGYFDPHVLVMAKKYPDVMFLHCGGLWNEKVHPKNVGSYFGYIDECQYLSGIVAGHTSKSKKIGFVAAKPIPQVRRNINAFALGARSVDPSITCTVIFTGDWSMPVKEAEATNSLIDQGVDVVTCHVDSPKVVVENAARRGIYICGYHCSQATLAPEKYLTGAEWNWEKVYTDYIKMYQSHQKIPNLVRGGLKEQIVKTSPYGPAVSDKAKKAAEDVKAKLVAGNFVIFKGEMKDNTGKVVIPAGKQYVQTAIELESMDYLVEGVKGQ